MALPPPYCMDSSVYPCSLYWNQKRRSQIDCAVSVIHLKFQLHCPILQSDAFRAGSAHRRRPDMRLFFAAPPAAFSRSGPIPRHTGSEASDQQQSHANCISGTLHSIPILVSIPDLNNNSDEAPRSSADLQSGSLKSRNTSLGAFPQKKPSFLRMQASNPKARRPDTVFDSEMYPVSFDRADAAREHCLVS